jgi:hypothetical protein
MIQSLIRVLGDSVKVEDIIDKNSKNWKGALIDGIFSEHEA